MIPVAHRSIVFDGVPQVVHAFFGRVGGVSPAPWDTLNVSFRVGDDGARVAENRRRICAVVGAPPQALFTANQVHGTRTLEITDDTTPAEAFDTDADVLVTRRPGALLGVQTADCIPLLVTTDDGTAVAAAHIGWRGAADGVVDAAVGALAMLGARPGRMVAAIGPCIGPHAFEVRRDVLGRFGIDPAGSHPCAERADAEHWRFDLARWTRRALRRRGVARVGVSGQCTHGGADTWFSYRRDNRPSRRTGGQLTVIGIAGASRSPGGRLA